MKKVLLMVGLSFLMNGCALIKLPAVQLPDEDKPATVRIYENIPKDEILKAGEKVLTLAYDGFKFEYANNTLLAARDWISFGFLSAAAGTDYWEVAVNDNDSTVSISLKREASPGLLIGSGKDDVLGKYIYELFFERLDYLLGKTDKWTTCKEAKVKMKEDRDKKIEHDLVALCGPASKDDMPQIK
ncbi:MAG: hypothetical protein LBF71_02755 [Campylobacteraceae bacterium]|nr:hypothetical protein [Campylobacteraceae bacterium]